MWRSPIQICGTVRRPLFCVISARRAGCRSTRIFSTSLTPLSASRRSADWQNGHAAVVYISTFATLLFHRQPGLIPRAEAASEIDVAAEALLPEGGRGLCGALAAVVVDDERLVLALRELAGVAALQARKRQVARAEDMAGAVVARVAHVEHQRVLAVDELRRLRDRDPGAARRPAPEKRGLSLRSRLHLGAQARHPHAVARARRARSDVAAGREELAAERAPLRRPPGAEQGRDGGEVRREAGARLAAQLRYAAAAIVDLNIPTGAPLVYELNDSLKPIRHYYLGNPDEIAQQAAAVASQGKAKA